MKVRRGEMGNLLIYISWIGIICLITINLSIVLTTVFINQKDQFNQKVYQKAYQQIVPILEESNGSQDQLIEKLNVFKTKPERKAIFQALVEYVQHHKVTINSLEILEKLGFIDDLVKDASKRLTLRQIQLFSQLRYNKAFPILINGAKSKNFETSYNSFYALSLLSLSQEELTIYVEDLLKTTLMRDRKIDMLNHLDIEVEKLLYFLEKYQTDSEKIIWLLVLKNRLKKDDTKWGNQLLPYLEGSKEVKIAVIQALAASGNESYFLYFKDLYQKEPDWQVRAVLSKNLQLLNTPLEQALLLEMLQDENWWVRHNAMTTLKERYPDSAKLNLIELEDINRLSQQKTKGSATN